MQVPSISKSCRPSESSYLKISNNYLMLHPGLMCTQHDSGNLHIWDVFKCSYIVRGKCPPYSAVLKYCHLEYNVLIKEILLCFGQVNNSIIEEFCVNLLCSSKFRLSYIPPAQEDGFRCSVRRMPRILGATLPS